MSDLYPNLFKNLTRSPITIILLDNRKQTMVYDKTTKLSSLFEATCDLCYVECDNLFGFAILMDDYYAFLDLDTKVCKLNFKEFSKKTLSNVLFKPWISYNSPVHHGVEDNRRHSQGMGLHRENNRLQYSTVSTKSAPVSNFKVNNSSHEVETPVIYFRIKSYVHSHCLRDRMTKMLYFQQLMRNVLDYKLQCADEIYLQLGAYAIQSFYGDFNLLLSSVTDADMSSLGSNNTDSSNTYSPTLIKLCRSTDRYQNFTRDQILSGHYFDPKKFFPSWIITKYSVEYLYKEISQLHKSLAGMSRFEAEFNYIRMASGQHSNFNMHLFPVRDQTISGAHTGTGTFSALTTNGKTNGVKNKNKLWLGLSPAGLEMHEMKDSDFLIHMSTLKWNDIDEVTQKSYRINIHVGCRSLKLYTNTKMQADHLFWLTRHMHIYQTKARLNATYTAEALENVERQKYREKYVYMDLEDLKKHGSLAIEPNESLYDEEFSHEFIFHSPSRPAMPIVNTPAVPPRRTPSKARPMKMKDLMRMSNMTGESVNGNSGSIPESTKKPQYIKKSNPSSHTNTYSNVIQKAIKSPEISLKDAGDSSQFYRGLDENGFERQSFQSDIDSDQNTSKTYETMDESDLTNSFNESECRSPGQFGLKYASRFISLSQDFNQYEDLSSNLSHEFNSIQDLLPPKEFREPIISNTHITKSISFDIYDVNAQKPLLSSQRLVLSDSEICNANLQRSLPMIMGLCNEFSDTKIVNDIKSIKFYNALKKHKSKDSVGMKTWKSDILFNLNACELYNDDHSFILASDTNSSIGDDPHYLESHDRRNSLPQHQTPYGDLISSSSTLDTANDHDSVDISSLSSYDFDCRSTSPFKNTNSQDQKAHLTII